MDKLFDVAIIGGGINGCGIAADASMRGLSVVLIEKDDLASKTSSSSTKLIHGGLRYLELYDFSLVKKALDERQILLNMAPHLVFPRPFVLPFQQSLRPALLIRAGLFLYDHLSRSNTLPTSKTIHRSPESPFFRPLADSIDKGFVFYDCCTDDARLTLTNAMQAKQHGATILTQTEMHKAREIEGIWHLTCQNKSGKTQTIQSRALINAAGPWVDSVSQKVGIFSQYKITLVKGSHIVVPRLYEGEHGYLLQHEDKRVVFVIPYHGFSMIGTTDILFSSSPDKIEITPDEIDYLLLLVQRYFKRTLTKESIITTWSGVRPLLAANEKSPQTISRDYVFHYTHAPAPAVTIYGGKITTYRQLARDAVNELRGVFPLLPDSTTDKQPLPGAMFGSMNYSSYLAYAHEHYYWLDKNLLERWLTTYGTRTEQIVSGCSSMGDLGHDFGHGLYQREIDYLISQEWAISCDDILWRRTKLGLNFQSDERKLLNEYVSAMVHESCIMA